MTQRSGPPKAAIAARKKDSLTKLASVEQALKRLLIAQKPDWWRVIANHWPDLLGPPPARHISFDEPLKSGDAVHLIMMW